MAHQLTFDPQTLCRLKCVIQLDSAFLDDTRTEGSDLFQLPPISSVQVFNQNIQDYQGNSTEKVNF